MTLIVEPADRKDLPTLVDLLLAQLGEHDIPTPRAGVEAAVTGCFDDPRRARILVARRDATLVGLAYVSFIWALEHGGLSAWLEELYVVPAERDHGVGRRLLDAAIELARRTGCAAVDLEVETAHTRAENLYLRAGFRRHSRSRWIKRL
jgi:GNAT superfamily N-acetyltransferase